MAMPLFGRYEMSRFDSITSADQQQLSLDDLLAIIAEEENRAEDSQTVAAAVANIGAPISPESGIEPHIPAALQGDGNGFPSGWMFQIIDIKQPFTEALAEAEASFQQRFGHKPKTVWANPATGDGDQVSHDRRIGRGYLLLGPLPREG